MESTEKIIRYSAVNGKRFQIYGSYRVLCVMYTGGNDVCGVTRSLYPHK